MRNLDHPSPHFNAAKMARFCSFAPSSLLWGGGGGGWGIIVSLYFVQDCRFSSVALHEREKGPNWSMMHREV